MTQPEWRWPAAAVAAAVLACGVSGAQPAVAHGPCDCLDPRLVQAGGKVRVVGSHAHGTQGRGQPAYRVLFNPRPSDYGIAPSYLAGAHRADVPTSTVLSRPEHSPTRRGTFRVPGDTPPGLYLVLVFDGEEGGAHNTWDYLHVFAADGSASPGVVSDAARATATSPAQWPPPAERDDSPGPWAWVAIAALAGLALGALAGRVRRPGPS